MRVVVKATVMMFMILSMAIVVCSTGIYAQAVDTGSLDKNIVNTASVHELKINVNTASVDELLQLKRVLLKHAYRIVDYRSIHGPFRIPEEIMEVRGITYVTLEENKNLIVFE